MVRRCSGIHLFLNGVHFRILCAKKVLFAQIVVTNRGNSLAGYSVKTRITGICNIGTMLAQKKIDEVPILKHYGSISLRIRPLINTWLETGYAVAGVGISAGRVGR